MDGDEFASLLSSEEGRKRAWADFAEARSLGVTGFPTLLVHDGDEWAIVGRVYVPAAGLLPALSEYLLNRYTEAGEGLFCKPGTIC